MGSVGKFVLDFSWFERGHLESEMLKQDRMSERFLFLVGYMVQ